MGHLQIIACAGAGKTRELTLQIVELLLSGTPPESVIAFTFTEKAAAELKARVERYAAQRDHGFKQLPPAARGLFVGTIHSWALNALQHLGGRYELFEAMSEEREWALLLRVARRLGIVDLYAQVFCQNGERIASAVAAEVFQRSLEVVYNERLPRPVLHEHAPAFTRVVERYERLLDGMQLFSFGSMIDRCADELESGRLRQALQGRIRHVFVDEFQDLNRAQEALLRSFAAMGASISVVGDDDQAIYQWRGGDVELFTGFASRFDDVETHSLSTNYRSLPRIVRLAQRFASGIEGRKEKEMLPHHTTEDPAVEVGIADTPEQEAAWVADRIGGLVGQGMLPGDIAVLFRSVRTAAGPLVEALRRRSIPVRVIGRLPLLDRPEMALVARIFVFWGGGRWYPGFDNAEEVVTAATLRDALEQLGWDGADASRAIAGIVDLGDSLKREGVGDLIQVFNEVLAILGLPGKGGDTRRVERSLGQLSRLLTEFEHAQRRALPADFLAAPPVRAPEEDVEDGAVHAAATVEAPGPREVALGLRAGEILFLRLKSFLQEYAGRAAEEAPDQPGAEADAVTIMTVHQSKGLEFPVVFLPSLVRRRFPSARCGEKRLWYVPDRFFDRSRYEGREQDEARLFYVALTRAKRRLVLSSFRGYGTGRQAKPSPFLVRVLRDSKGECSSFRLPAPEREDDARAGDTALDTGFAELSTYEECGFKYWLRYECGFQPPLARPLGFGRVVHHVLAELARLAAGGERVTPDVAQRLLAERFYLPFAGKVDREKLFEGACRRIVGYVRQFGPELARTVGVEEPFEVPLSRARVRGRIDLLLRHPGGGDRDVTVVDFKTTESRPPPEIHHNQLRLYGDALRALGYKPVGLYVHDLERTDEDARQEIPQDPEAVAGFRERMAGWVSGIGEGRFEPCEDRAETCPRCDFKRFCRWAPRA